MSRLAGDRKPPRRAGWPGRAPDAAAHRPVRPPDPHVDGARPPAIPAELVPRHVALVMDGNGRWAKARDPPPFPPAPLASPAARSAAPHRAHSARAGA